MKYRYWLTVVLLWVVRTTTFGQTGNKDKDWRVISKAYHQKDQWLIGGGCTLLGLTAKAGKFVANRTWVGLSGELTALSESRIEAGVFSRYYLWAGGLASGFAEAGVSYGRFREFVDSDSVRPPRLSYSPKLTAGFGLEIPLHRQVALEGVAKIGRLTETNWVQPGFQGSLNIYFAR